MCRTASLFFLQRLKGSVSCDARDFNNTETRAVVTFFFATQGAEKKFKPFWKKHEGNMRHRMPPSKSGWRSLNVVIFFTCFAPRPGRLQTGTTPEIIEQIHKLILEDRRISANSIAEQLSISPERVGSIIHEDLDMRKLSAKWVQKRLNADQKRQRCQSSEQRLEFFRGDLNIFLSRLVTI